MIRMVVAVASALAIAGCSDIVVGTSSSIFIAAPILLFLGERRLRKGAAEEAKAPA